MMVCQVHFEQMIENVYHIGKLMYAYLNSGKDFDWRCAEGIFCARQ